MASDSGEKKANVDDISLEEQRPVRKSGGGGLGWLIVIIIVVAVALFAYSAYVKKQQAEAEAKAKADAAVSRVAQIGVANGNVKDAVTLAEQGNMVAAIAKLQTAESLYATIISSANEMGEQDAAADALAKKGVIQDARQALELEQQRFQEAVKVQLDALRSGFGIPAPTQPAPTEAEQAPAAEAQPPAAAPEEQPVAGAEAQPAPEQPAATTEQPADTAAPQSQAAPAAGG